MNKNYLIKNASLINEGCIKIADVLISKGQIKKINTNIIPTADDIVIKGTGKFLLPGVIDDQVHFREPGLTYKADIYSESRAAVAGGVTSFMEMPNTVPNTLTIDLLEEKYEMAAKKSLANYSFFMGASNDNINEVLKVNPKNVCGVKIFMGSSTGNMLVDSQEALEDIFSKCKMLIAAHCEDESTIRANSQLFKEKYGEDVPIQAHPLIRSAEACYKSSSFAIELAKKHNARLHVLHISTAREIELFEKKPLKEKRITAEACIHHLWFTDEDYKTKGTLIKWNPAVKTKADRDAILNAVKDGFIDIIATDHAPHTLEEKQNKYFSAPSGGPLVQHGLVAMCELYHQGKISLEKIVEKMCHAPAELFEIEKRGFIREGYWADLVLIDLNSPWKVEKENIFYKCGWSPFEGQVFKSKINYSFVNGHPVYQNGTFDETIKGSRLMFDRA
ncbi:MAG: dihydroorotase [Bacteroidetes bacterium]|nr:dihydroorotase [Bacteroidota bacterium]HET6245735.1 dihydroorotase [Bacteroidia bacterium]